ncbi:hypothetical protein Goshw_006664 [Gossypium schwendimanii]|uniref:Reverse transcriptase zinc-binding domain-containing protein n=1 Tax=Gossypium schwendimanii TaxID=34291 RepID=A0A7J9L949_GOSSC|nr:hypothetical protein [Gossypium schwendimanii]
MGPYRLFWRMIWKLKTLLKIRVFAWRLEHNLLPTKDRIALMHQHEDRECFRCGDKRETLIHALKDCPNARAVLTRPSIKSKWTLTRLLLTTKLVSMSLHVIIRALLWVEPVVLEWKICRLNGLNFTRLKRALKWPAPCIPPILFLKLAAQAWLAE